MSTVSPKYNPRVPLADKTNVLNMKSARISNIKPKFGENVPSAKTTQSIKNVVPRKVKGQANPYVACQEQTVAHIKGLGLRPNLIASEPVSAENDIRKSLKIILMDVFNTSDNRISRRTRSKSICLTTPIQEKLNSANKPGILTNDFKVDNLKNNKTILSRAKSNPDVCVLDNFSKNLKVVLTNVQAENNILRRRSKSHCEEKCITQKCKVNKGITKRTISQSQSSLILENDKNINTVQRLDVKEKNKSINVDNVAKTSAKIKKNSKLLNEEMYETGKSKVKTLKCNGLQETRQISTKINNMKQYTAKASSIKKPRSNSINRQENLKQDNILNIVTRKRSKSICTEKKCVEVNFSQNQDVARQNLQVILEPMNISAQSTAICNSDPIKNVRTKKRSPLLDENKFHVPKVVKNVNKKLQNKVQPTQAVTRAHPDNHSNKNVEGINIKEFKTLHVRLIPLEDKRQEIIVKEPVSLEKNDLGNKEKNQSCKSVMKVSEIHNLRRLQPKNYMEESILDSPCVSKEKASGVMEACTNMNKKDSVPIYKKMLPEKPETKPQNQDLYEFTDSSPKVKKIARKQRQHRSSILFDKNTHEILQKLEEKEAKAKKKDERKKKNLKTGKSYNKIVKGIISNVMQQISKKNGAPEGPVNAANLIKVQSKPPNNNKQVLNPSNNFQEEMNIIVHSSSEVPSTIRKAVPEVSTKKAEHLTVTTRKPQVNSESQSKHFFNMSDVDPILLHSIGSCDNSVSQRDIDSCFGFDDVCAPVASTPAKTSINVLNNIIVRRGIHDVESPIDFNARRPNANSTMVQTRAPRRTSSPWRANLTNRRHNPHFVHIKGNALPRIHQEMVLNHTLVDGYENACSKTDRTQSETPVKKSAVQQSILDFVESNVEKETNDLQCSLYDYEAFNSPEKKTKRKGKSRMQEVKRNVLDDENIVLSSTPIHRRPLADISNSSEETREPNVTYFGFDESNQVNARKTSEKRQRINQENNASPKPSRFDINKIKMYTKKAGNTRKQASTETQRFDDLNRSISIFEASNEDNVEEVHLFEDIVDDNMSPVRLDDKRTRRKRLDSCDSDSSDYGKRRKRHKKTKFEIEQEAWMNDFNTMCDEVDSHELEIV